MYPLKIDQITALSQGSDLVVGLVEVISSLGDRPVLLTNVSLQRQHEFGANQQILGFTDLKNLDRERYYRQLG